MGTVLIIMTAGMLAGFLLRKKQKLMGITEKLVMVAIFVLLFFMGVSIGKDNEIIQALPTLGVEALMVSVFAILGSLLVSMFVYRLFFKGKAKQEETKYVNIKP